MRGGGIGRAVPREGIRHGRCSQRRVPVSLGRRVRGLEMNTGGGGGGMERGERALCTCFPADVEASCSRPNTLGSMNHPSSLGRQINSPILSA